MAGTLAVAAAPASAGHGKADLLVKKAGSPFIGNDIYEVTSDPDQRACAVGTELDFVFKVQNETARKRKLFVLAVTENDPGATTTVTLKGKPLGADVRSVGKVEPGKKSKPIKAHVEITGNPGTGGRVGVAAAVRREGNTQDIVQAIYRNSGICVS